MMDEVDPVAATCWRISSRVREGSREDGDVGLGVFEEFVSGFAPFDLAIEAGIAGFEGHDPTVGKLHPGVLEDYERDGLSRSLIGYFDTFLIHILGEA